MSDFCHLHCHTEYSLLDGAIRITDLCARAVDLGMPAAAITDHGNMFGALNFYLEAKKYGIKPIIGCEVYLAHTHHQDREQLRYHLVLLAMDRQGYHNLIKIVTRGWLEGFYYKPRVDKDILREHNQGLICLSACLQGEVQHVLRRQGYSRARETARQYADIFPGRFYLELEANGIPEQMEVNAQLLEMSGDTGLPLVATNDCHYLGPDDVQAHDILLCIQTNTKVQNDSRLRFDTDQLYYKSVEEMEKEFAHCPQALENVQEIIKLCNLEIETDTFHFPRYTPTRESTLDQEFISLSREGLEQRFQELPYSVDQEHYRQRLEEELEIICSMGFPGYFLIVQDFINWAKSQDIPVGPGRGSAAGSLVAYALRITNLDPIRYTLLFERFLNKERASMPDIDVDFCYDQREKVLRYVADKYGRDSVAQITTFGTMKARAVVRDVGRALGMKLSLTDRIAKLIPEELKMTIDKAIDQEPDLRKMVDEDEEVARLMDICRRLEGLVRHASTHAAGIVISDRAMQEHLPLYRGKKGEVVTQFDMKRVEKVGLIKFDFLGLKTLTVLKDTLELAARSGKDTPDLDSLPLEDPETFKLLGRGLTDGVFQLESSGMRKVLVDLKPTCFEDIIALLALYRPGPLESGMVTDFIKRKHGQIPVEYPHPELEPVLKETYGVILYQEQVMKIAQVLGGYSLGDGDILRRAMGKKDPAVMATQRSKFLQGASKHGVDEAVAEHIFNLVEKFAGYGFNKSHSAAYALISYQTAYLKAHFPQEFMAALITSEVSNTDKVIAHVNACRDMEITVLPPCINSSLNEFSVEDGHVRFGLSGIKNVGRGAIEAVIKERKKNGLYESLLDFCERVGSRKATRRVLEMLVKSGAMDNLGCSRRGLLAGMDMAAARAQRSAKNRNKGQLSMLSLLGEDTCSVKGLGLDCPENSLAEFQEDEKLKLEKEALGFYLSGHPLLPFRRDIQRLQLSSVQQCLELKPGTQVELPVVIVGKKEHISKKGDKMAFCQIEDLTGTAEVIMFGDLYVNCREAVNSEQPLLLKARISSYQGNQSSSEEDGETPRQVKFTAENVSYLDQAIADGDQPVHIETALEGEPRPEWIDDLKGLLTRYPGRIPVCLDLHLEDSTRCRVMLGPGYCVNPDREFWNELEKLGMACRQ
ncbi:DNA polymerase III subunit alpha [Desulfonatronospira sp.]|uniref:DNA polymerase III subunit alpha n=1 Tax=Desulfonatronospira sp. TaxID=1962951 RepID=UPI0025B8BAD5|nr:DNA polymerase III subunit alpha [Desulfonatronospira sp.]